MITSTPKYLGEFPIDINSDPTYNKFTPADWAMHFVSAYGQIDGDHHKAWVLDQVARCLNGVPIIVVEARWDDGTKEIRIRTSTDGSPEYEAWVVEMRGTIDEETGEYEYSYDTGVCP